MLTIFVFHNRTRHRIMNLFTFSRKFKHVDAYTFNGKQWIGFRMSSDGITYTISEGEGRNLVEEAKKLPDVEAIIGVQIDKRAHFPWRPLTIPMCNEFARLISGVDTGASWNPRHLYNKLLKYNGRRNFEIFYRWRVA